MKIGSALRPKRRDHATADEGFTLIEVIVALVLTVTVMTGSAAFFIRAIATTRLMQQRQAAAGVAEQAMERVRAEPSDALADGTDLTLSGGESVTPTTDPAYRVGATDYTVRTTINECELQPVTGSECDADAVASTGRMLRVNIQVGWSPGRGVSCSGSGGACEYHVTTLVDPTNTSHAQRVKEVPS